MAFASDVVTGTLNIYQKASSGAGGEELLVSSELRKIPTSWSPDGRFLLYQAEDPKTGSDLWILPMESTRMPVPLLQTPFNEGEGAFSPDGRWIAFSSNEAGRGEIHVMPFAPPSPGSASGVGKVRVSKDGGAWPKWRADGKELFFTDPNRVLMSADVSTDSTVQPGLPISLFTLPQNSGDWTVTADGKRFLVSMPLPITQVTPITVLLNWESLPQR